MVDRVIVGGVSKVDRFVFKEILLELGQRGLESYTQDFLKGRITDFSGILQKEPFKVAVGQLLKEFLQLMQEELEIWGYSKEELQEYSQALKQFIHADPVKALLAEALQPSCESLNPQTLAQTWEYLQLLPLPAEFDWQSIAQEYLTKVQGILQQSHQLRTLLEQPTTRHLEMPGVVPKFDLQQYRESLQEFYGQLNLADLHTNGYEYRVPLSQVFVSPTVREAIPVCDLPLEYQKQLQQANQLEGEISPDQLRGDQQIYEQQPSRPVLEILRDSQYPYIVILGNPGAGKSTLAQYLALTWAEDPQSQSISLLIELRNYIRTGYSHQTWPKTFLEYIQQREAIFHLNSHLPLHSQLKSGNAFVIFDGLDEVFDSAVKEAVITQIIHFTQEYPQVRVVVTSRIIGYKSQQLRQAQFQHFTLQDWEAGQITQFLDKWHQVALSNHPDKERLREQIQKMIQASSSVRQLAGNPLLLTMMAILNQSQELPRHRPELYAQVARVLLHRWDIETGLPMVPGTLGLREKEGMLRQVAYHMQVAPEGFAGNIITAVELENIWSEYLDTLEFNNPRGVAKLIIEQLRTRPSILCHLGADYYGFLHRSFCDYFCAAYFVEQFKEKRTLTLATLKNEVFGKHQQDAAWHEILRLITGMIDAKFAGEIIDYMIERNRKGKNAIDLFLATKYLSEVKNRLKINETATKLLNHLKEINQFGSDYDQTVRAQAIAAIATAWKNDPETLPWLKTRAQSEGSATVRLAVVQRLARGWKHDPDTLPWLKTKAQSDYISFVRQAAVQELARGWKNHRDTLPWLQSIAQSDQSSAVRKAALQEIAKGWKHEPDILPWLQTLAQLNDDVEVRACAVQEIVNGWQHSSNILRWLQSLAQSDNDSAVRRVGLQEIIAGWKDDPQTLPWLKARIRSDGHPAVRQVAVQEFAKGWKDDPQLLSILKDCAQLDPDLTVRKVALQEIIRSWKDHPDTLPWLQNCAHTDDKSAVRQAALQELARSWKNDPYTLVMLKNRAQLDEDADVRRVAVQELAKGWRNDLSIFTILKSRAESDQNPGVRRAAIQGIARSWRKQPNMFEFLQDCALKDPFKREDNWATNPRQTALEAIIEQYAQHPQTPQLLYDRLENDLDEKVRKYATEQLMKLKNAHS